MVSRNRITVSGRASLPHHHDWLCLVTYGSKSKPRAADLNYVHQKYGRLAEANAFNDIAQNLPFEKEMKDAYTEEQAKQTLESKLAKDADQLEWIATLCEEETKGNKKARVWAEIAYKRLKTPAAKKLGKSLLETHPDNWWFDEKDAWFVNRKTKNLKS